MSHSQNLRDISSQGTRVRLILVILGIVFTCSAAAVRADDGPRLNKTRLYVKLWQNHSYWPPKATQEQYDTTSWLPSVRFRVFGPLPGGSQFSVDITRPDGSLCVSLDCPTEEIRADQWLDVETPREPTGGTKVFTTGTGVYGFTIRLKNALSGQPSSLLREIQGRQG